MNSKQVAATALAGLGFLLGTLSGCAPGPPKNNSDPTNNPTTTHNSRNSLDWPGAYTGTLPAADAQGIQTILQLRSDMTYSLATRYVGKSGATVQRSGTFAWDKAGSTITLNGIKAGDVANRWQVGENKLMQLDPTGKRINGASADRYVLRKERTSFTDTYWKLVELNGKPVPATQSGRREAHMILKRDNNRVQGSGGCNTFGGSYELTNGGRVRFSKVAATKMACADMTVEDQFFTVLSTADSYVITGETLQLNRDRNRARMAPLAKFEAVYLR